MRRNANDSPTTHSPARQSRPPRCARPCQHPQGLSRPIQEKPHSVALHSAAARALPSIAASDPDRWPGRAQTEAPCSRRARVPQTLCRASSSAAMCVAARHRDQSSRIVTSRALFSPVAFARTFTTRLTGTAARADRNSRSLVLRARAEPWLGGLAICRLGRSPSARCAVPCLLAEQFEPDAHCIAPWQTIPEPRRTSLAHRHSVEPLQTALYAPSMSVATEGAADIPIATLLDRTQSRQTESGRTRRITLGRSGPPHLALPRKPLRVHRPAIQWRSFP